MKGQFVKRMYRESIIMVKLLNESMLFAVTQLKGDKFRTFLSLFGVSIGIFSIVAIFTAIDALQENVRKGMDSFSSDVILVAKWPSSGEDEDGEMVLTDEYKWWEYMRRPNTTYDDFMFLKENVKTADAVALAISLQKTVKYGRNSVSGVQVACVTSDFNKVNKIDLGSGRYISPEDDNNGSAVAVIGYELCGKIFKGEDPLGKRIKVGDLAVQVIGVVEKQGESIARMSMVDLDEAVIIPLSFGRYMVNPNRVDNNIFLTPKKGVVQTDFVDEVKNVMRAHRRLKPDEKNNFSIIKMTFFFDIVQNVFSTINLVGWVIAGFSLLIGGFGIANIMFVSVKERTNIIGIQKALGAKKYVIMAQFLVEAAFLAVAGGIIGIVMVALGILAVPADSQFTVTLSIANIISGVLISSVIGVISGLIPAWIGANLNPVDAINSK